MNTSKTARQPADIFVEEETLRKIRERLTEFYLHDTTKLDELLNTNFFSKWFAHNTIPKE